MSKRKALSNAASLPGDAEACTVALADVCRAAVQGRTVIIFAKKEGRYGQQQRRRRTKSHRGKAQAAHIGVTPAAFPAQYNQRRERTHVSDR